MKFNDINNRFLDDSSWSEIQSRSLEDLLESSFTQSIQRKFISLTDALVDIAKSRSHYEGQRESKPEDDFVPLLGAALGLARYAKPTIASIGREPDFTFSRQANESYMNLYRRSREQFWEQTDFIFEVKPVGFVLEGYDPDTKRLWVDKCGWMTKSAGVKIGVLTNFCTWYFVRYSQEDEAKYLAITLEGSTSSNGGELVEFDERVLRRNAEQIAKMLILISHDEFRDRLVEDFSSVDNEELNIANQLLPRFTDAISLVASSLDGDVTDVKVIREATTSVFCVWSVLSKSELIGLDIQKNLALGTDYLSCLKTYLENPNSATKTSLFSMGEQVRRNVHELYQYVIETLPTATQKEFRKSKKLVEGDVLHRVAYLLFVETVKNKIVLRGTHKLGASSISTIFEGSLSFNANELSRLVDHTSDYWHGSLGTAPEFARITFSRVLLVEPPKEDDKKRKKLGAYFTPTPICDYLIAKLNFNFIGSDHPVAMDPTCGTGQFLLSYIRNLAVSKIVSPEVLSKCVIGNDIEPLAIFVSAYRINSYLSRVVGKMNSATLHLHCFNFTSPKEFAALSRAIPQVHHVIGNPPFGAEGNGHGSYSNTWMSCLHHVKELGDHLSVGMVLPASFANTSEESPKALRNVLIANSGRFHAVAFDTRPKPIFPDNDQRPIFITFDYGLPQNQKDILSGGYRRHSADKTIQQSLQEIEWHEVPESDTLELFPLPSSESEANLVRVAFDLLRRGAGAGQFAPRNTGFPVSVLSYGRYNLNAIMGRPPVGGGSKWRTYYFTTEEAAARMVVGLNSNLGWSLFRSLTNGLDFNNRLVTIINALPKGIGKGSSCIKVAKSFSNMMREAYEQNEEYLLAGRSKEFESLNKAAQSAFRLKSLGIKASDCSDTERLRVLKTTA